MSSFLHSPNQQTDLSTEACKKHKQTDLYEILGVSRDATQEIIKEKFYFLIQIREEIRNNFGIYKLLTRFYPIPKIVISTQSPYRQPLRILRENIVIQ
jgi:hypothetical protein